MMAYTFFPKTATEVIKKLNPKNADQIAKVGEIGQLLNFLKNDKKTKGIIDTPINIDPLKITSINISRKLKPVITEAAIKKAVNLNKIKIRFGDGSAGGRGVNNKGGKFEKDLGPAFENWWTGKKIQDADLLTAVEEVYDKTILKNWEDLFVLQEGAANTKRPLQFTQNITIMAPPDNNIGKMVTDITLKNNGKSVYLSLKSTTTVTFFNVGVKTILTTPEIKSGNITNKDGLKLLKLIGIDPALFTEPFNKKGYLGFEQKIKLSASKISKLEKLIESGIGYGYTVVHQLKKGDVKVFNVTKKYMQDASTVVGPLTVYYGGKTGTGKRVDVEVKTKKYLMNFNIRDTQGGDGYPTRLMCNFKYL
jgi:hypothetical protein